MKKDVDNLQYHNGDIYRLVKEFGFQNFVDLAKDLSMNGIPTICGKPDIESRIWVFFFFVDKQRREYFHS